MTYEWNKNRIDDIVNEAMEYSCQESIIENKKQEVFMENKLKEYITEINDNFDIVEPLNFNEIKDGLDPKIIWMFLIIMRVTYQELLKLNTNKIESRNYYMDDYNARGGYEGARRRNQKSYNAW
ncbi:2539_t:CDS:2 [Scutellospora calospora]|uniref:2539_t:CDS:1 n=1 Tax=Scutellospora calospora TaxID=85575 RepID=A0ACA9LKP1_9GLOM|nr:2539_t:CDS:2 [Scutellospora calospora]